MRRRARDEHGAVTTLALVWLFPLLLVLMLMIVQAALWQHANATAIAAAQHGAADVARAHLDVTAAHDAVVAALQRDHLSGIDVTVTARAGTATVTVAADAPGVLVGTHVRLHATATEALEGWRTP